MRRSLSVLAIAGILTGCAGVYDQGEVPRAKARLDLQVDSCANRGSTNAFPNIAAVADCYVVADRAFAITVKLQRTDLFGAYAARMAAIGQDADAGRIGKTEAASRFDRARGEYYASLEEVQKSDTADGRGIKTVLAVLASGIARQQPLNPGARP